MALRSNLYLNESYLTEVRQHIQVDLFGEPSWDRMDFWIRERTRGKFPKVDFVKTESFALINAVYYRSFWLESFRERSSGFFYSHVPLLAMWHEFARKVGQFPYATFGDGQLVELPYRSNSTLTLYLFVPSQCCAFFGRILAFLRLHPTPVTTLLGQQSLDSRIKELKSTLIDLHIPRFTAKASYELTDILQNLGVKDAFDSSRANFNLTAKISPNTSTEPLPRAYLDQVIHKTYFRLDDSRTEESSRVYPKAKQILSVRVNRPFAFFVRDKAANVTLFAGVIYNPV